MLVHSYIAGVLFVPFAVFETGHWWFQQMRGEPSGYPVVTDVWQDRSGLEVIAYVVGHLTFLCWPALPALLGWGSMSTWRTASLVCAALFGAFTLLTLVLPIGARQRYRWLSRQTHSEHQRLFVGQVPAPVALRARGAGAWTLLLEFLAILAVVVFAPAVVNFCAWTDLGRGAFLLASGDPRQSLSLLDFIYYSVVTATTTGVGDIVPVLLSVQLVAVAQLLLTWLYVAGTLPMMLGVIIQPSMLPGDLMRGSIGQRTPASEAIRRGMRRLTDERATHGGWAPQLSPDVFTSAFVVRALEESRMGEGPKVLIPSHLRSWCEARVDQEESQVLREAVRLCLTQGDVMPVTSALPTALRAADLPGGGSAVLAWIAAVLSGDPALEQIARAAQLPGVEDWTLKYGRHWGAYAAVVRLLAAKRWGTPAETKAAAASLLSTQAPGWSWFGDNLLTAVSSMALARADIGQTAWHSATVWLAERVRQRAEGVSLVANLDVWHTGLALRLLGVAGAERERLEPAADWLVRCFLRDEALSGWPWSSESTMLCLDSTSTVTDAISAFGPRRMAVQSTADEAAGALRRIWENAQADSFLMPTFVEDGRHLNLDPIVTARCIRLLDRPSAEKRGAASAVLKKLALENWASEWFTTPEVTNGLVLWYLGPMLTAAPAEVKSIADGLVASVSGQGIPGPEGWAAAALGLQAAGKYATGDDAAAEAVRVLVDSLLSTEENGRWAGPATCYFGFGRSYKDSHVATVLALQALLACGGASDARGG